MLASRVSYEVLRLKSVIIPTNSSTGTVKAAEGFRVKNGDGFAVRTSMRRQSEISGLCPFAAVPHNRKSIVDRVHWASDGQF